MTKLTRKTAKIFGETASTTNTPKEIGQFGSAKAGTYNATSDIDTIQSLPAWSNGWIDAVTATDQFPPLPEMTGVHKVLSYQNAYLLQQGIPEWDSATTYYTNNFCSSGGNIYKSLTDNNVNHNPTSDTINWEVFGSFELPSQTGNSGKVLQTNGTDPSWTALKTVNGNSILGSGNINVSTDISGKANISLNNLSATGKSYTSTACFPKYSAMISGSLPYTATVDGWAFVKITGGSSIAKIFVNSIQVAQVGSSGTAQVTFLIPMLKGQQLTTSGGVNPEFWGFFPLAGE